MENKDTDLDRIKVNRLKLIIFGMVKDNLKIKKYNKGEMTDLIKKRIRQEVLD